MISTASSIALSRRRREKRRCEEESERLLFSGVITRDEEKLPRPRSGARQFFVGASVVASRSAVERHSVDLLLSRVLDFDPEKMIRADDEGALRVGVELLVVHLFGERLDRASPILNPDPGANRVRIPCGDDKVEIRFFAPFEPTELRHLEGGRADHDLAEGVGLAMRVVVMIMVVIAIPLAVSVVAGTVVVVMIVVVARIAAGAGEGEREDQEAENNCWTRHGDPFLEARGRAGFCR